MFIFTQQSIETISLFCYKYMFTIWYPNNFDIYGHSNKDRHILILGMALLIGLPVTRTDRWYRLQNNLMHIH